jgi:bisphosphoglycerate-independent phosphoglycerate mutase (AlkP superfamily)
MGLYVYYDPTIDLEGIEEDMKIADVAPTLLRAMGLPVPLEMEGRPLHYV